MAWLGFLQKRKSGHRYKEIHTHVPHRPKETTRTQPDLALKSTPFTYDPALHLLHRRHMVSAGAALKPSAVHLQAVPGLARRAA